MLPSNLLPPGTEYFIAGGFAACPALAEDVDVWVPVDTLTASQPWETVWRARREMVAHLRAAGFVFTEVDGDFSPRDRKRLLFDSTFEGYRMPLPIYRAGVVTIPGHRLPYHIILVGANVDEVLSSFDISTHQVALTARGVVCGDQWTPITEEPKVILQKYTTDARLKKIRARYGFDKEPNAQTL